MYHIQCFILLYILHYLLYKYQKSRQHSINCIGELFQSFHARRADPRAARERVQFSVDAVEKGFKLGAGEGLKSLRFNFNHG